MTEEIYQTIKSMLEEARGDRYPRLARLIGPVEPHLLVNYEGGQIKAGEALKLEKERHDKITAALEWLEQKNMPISYDAGTSVMLAQDKEFEALQDAFLAGLWAEHTKGVCDAGAENDALNDYLEKQKVKYAPQERVEPGDSLGEHTGDDALRLSTTTSSSGSAIHSEKEQEN